MAVAGMNQWVSLLRWCQPDWWAGPVFQKELRVASRRRRSYLLRCAYVLLLTAYIALVWLSAVSLARSGAMSRAQMQVAAYTITRGIVWFQFFGGQAVVLILMSTSISEEVYRRTLGALMSTPLSRRQVVMNKFVSRLFQVLLLVAASLPLLAIVRVLGGIAWSYVVVSLCVTAATVIFVGSVSLFFSALCRRAHFAVLASVLTIVFLFVLVPILTGSSRPIMRWQTSRFIPPALITVNPYALLRYCPNLPTAALGTALAGTRVAVMCCLLLLLGAGLILLCSERLVGGLALRRAMGEPVLLDRLRHARFQEITRKEGPRSRPRRIRRVVGPPMIWKELICTFSGRQKFAARMVLGVEILLTLIVLLFPVMITRVPYELLLRGFVWAFLGLAVLITMIVPASVMSAERESRAWPVLLLTPLTDREILLGKFVGVVRRCGAVWLLLLAYVAGFAYAGSFHPLAIVQMAAVIGAILSTLAATGFYFGLRLRRTTEAVTANLLLAGLLWCVPSLFVGAVEHWIGGRGHWASSVALVMVPFAQVSSMMHTTLDGRAGTIPWLGQSLSSWEFTRLMLVSMLGHMVVALLFLWRTMRGLRRRIL
jgi:ABC-type transport system involved in multi-copper enzyme maturation permease subunit